MTYKSLEEQEIISNFLINNNLFIHKIEKKENILNFLKNIKVFQTNLIRIGSKNDGGYLVPDDLKNINACFPYIEKYLPNAELWITENGLSSEDGDEQCLFLHDHVERVFQNPKVKRYYWWTLLDCWEWDYARKAKFGLVSVNPKTFRRKKKRSFSCYQSLIQQ